MGPITSSDLELAGSIAQNDILAQVVNLREKTTHNSYDNIVAVYWQRTGATTTLSPAAFLLRLQALHQRFFCYVPLHDYIPGPINVMADFLSRHWNLTNNQILSHFNLHFPQKEPWRLCPLRTDLNSSLISALSRQRSEPALMRTTPKRRIVLGSFGKLSVPKPILTPFSSTSKIHSPISKSLAEDYAMVNSPPAVVRSDLQQFQTTLPLWARGSPASSMGADDPRLNKYSKIYFCLAQNTGVGRSATNRSFVLSQYRSSLSWQC